MGAAFLSAPKKEKEVEDGENKRFAFGVASMQGWRTEMEDAHIANLSDDEGNGDVSFFAVFDGHCGSEVAEYCSAHWVDHVRSLDSFPNNLTEALRRSFFLMDEELLDPTRSAEIFNTLKAQRLLEARKRKRFQERDCLEREVRARMEDASSKGSLSSDEALSLAEIMAELEKEQKDQRKDKITDAGCTAICAAIRGNTLVVANAGDSRGVLCRKNGTVFPLSEDHKPDNKIEFGRISRAGGWVSNGRVNGQLALSRAIGDFDFKRNQEILPEEQAVTCDPDILTVQLEPGDEFMILACDGIWDVVSNEKAVNLVKEELKKGGKISDAISRLFDHCLATDTNGVGTDNMTCVVVVFKDGAFN